MEWLSIKGWFAGVFGSGMSLFFNKDKPMSMPEKVFIFVSGIGLAHYLGGAAIEYYHIDKTTMIADAVKFSVGLFGMGVCTQLWVNVPAVVKSLLNKWVS